MKDKIFGMTREASKTERSEKRGLGLAPVRERSDRRVVVFQPSLEMENRQVTDEQCRVVGFISTLSRAQLKKGRFSRKRQW